MSDLHNELGNENWSVLEGEYQRCVQLILSLNAKVILEKAKDPKVLSQVSDRPALIKNIQVLNKDLNTFVQRLEAIHDTHKHLKGTTNGPDELIGLYGTWEEYANWIMAFNNVVIPNIHTIINQLHVDLTSTEIPFDAIQVPMEDVKNDQ